MGAPLHIVIDARWIFPEISGVGLYTQELVRALAEIDPANRYTLLFASDEVMARTIAVAGLSGHANVECKVFPVGLFTAASQWKTPALLRSLDADVYHSTNWMMPLLPAGRTRCVVTMHDLIPLLFRDHAPKSKKARLFPLYRGLMRRIASSAERIIAVSEATKKDIVRELKQPASKISVTLEGVSPAYKPPAMRELNHPHIMLFVGRRDPYKNLPLLVDAFALLRARMIVTKLRVLGPPDERYPEAPQRAKILGVDEDIEWAGYADPATLLEAYKSADVFVLPSRYEGFGLTVLEAMACGCPVVCSNVSSLPEVVGDAGILVPPGNAERLADAIAKVLVNRSLAADLSAKAVRRAAQFTWARTAEQTLAAYHKAVARP